MSGTWRVAVHACIHPETYKYFLDPAQVDPIWGRLERTLGPAREVAGFALRELQTAAYLLRAPRHGNPVTVIRSQRCSAAALERLHEALGFEESP